MNAGISTERCLSFISSQMSPDAQAARHGHKPAVTLSRQTGSGAMKIAGFLAEYLQKRCPTPGPWTIFDKNLIGKVLEEHNLPQEMAKFMPEDRVSSIKDMVEELLGLHPPSWTLLRQTTETILHLAEMGHVILIGRAANIITRPMRNVIHVRLVAPLEKRVEQVIAYGNPGREAALDFIRKEDVGRKRYLVDHFKADVGDPLLYDMVINTARFPHEEVAHMIGDAVLHRIGAV